MNRLLLLTFTGTVFANSVWAADSWDINENNAGFSIAEASWTIDKVFPGTKLIMDGDYAIRRATVPPRERDCECELPNLDRMIGNVSGHLQWGEGESRLEYGILAITGLAYQQNFQQPTAGFRRRRDTIEWGILQVGKDDPLGIDSYFEANVVRAGRTWGYRLSDTSPWLFTLGVNISSGYAWADSVDETYQDVSNLIIGSWFRVTVSRRGWGELYLGQRVTNGFTLSSPARGGSVSREARARFGYVKRFGNAFALEAFAEKRSFNFADPDLAGLYTKSRRVGAGLSYVF